MWYAKSLVLNRFESSVLPFLCVFDCSVHLGWLQGGAHEIDLVRADIPKIVMWATATSAQSVRLETSIARDFLLCKLFCICTCYIVGLWRAALWSWIGFRKVFICHNHREGFISYENLLHWMVVASEICFCSIFAMDRFAISEIEPAIMC